MPQIPYILVAINVYQTDISARKLTADKLERGISNIHTKKKRELQAKKFGIPFFGSPGINC